MHSRIQKEIIDRKLKCLLLGHAKGFDKIRESVFRIVRGESSDVIQHGHPTNWTNPKGYVRQYNLFSDTTYSDTQSNTGQTRDKVLQEFIEPYKALNFRINVLGDSSGLDQHIETIEISEGVKARFHLPIQTNEKATVFLDGDNYHLSEGNVYYFNNGCTHSAQNQGKPRIHLVWDCIVNKDVNSFVYDLLKQGKEIEPLYQSPINANAPTDTD